MPFLLATDYPTLRSPIASAIAWTSLPPLAVPYANLVKPPNADAKVLEDRWPEDRILAWFSELAKRAKVSQVRLRTNDSDKLVTLEEARLSILQENALLINVLYCVDGKNWSDTMMPAKPSTTIIRHLLSDDSL